MKTYLIQHLPGGDYDYSGFVTPEHAWEHEKTMPWVEEYSTLEEAKDEFIASLTAYDYDEMIDAHIAGEEWPEELGFIDEDAIFHIKRELMMDNEDLL